MGTALGTPRMLISRRYIATNSFLVYRYVPASCFATTRQSLARSWLVPEFCPWYRY